MCVFRRSYGQMVAQGLVPVRATAPDQVPPHRPDGAPRQVHLGLPLADPERARDDVVADPAGQRSGIGAH